MRAQRISDDILGRNVPVPGAAPSPDQNAFLHAVTAVWRKRPRRSAANSPESAPARPVLSRSVRRHALQADDRSPGRRPETGRQVLTLQLGYIRFGIYLAVGTVHLATTLIKKRVNAQNNTLCSLVERRSRHARNAVPDLMISLET